MWENIAGAKRYSRPRGFNIAGASTPVASAVPTPLKHRSTGCSGRVASASDYGVRGPGSNHAVDGCVYHNSCCDIQPWAQAAHLYCSA